MIYLPLIKVDPYLLFTCVGINRDNRTFAG